MKKIILRNIAIVSAVFIATFSIMLIVNYFQIRGATPLQTEVMETLKEINDRNADNPVLQEQIRQLDLLARRAYFVRMEQMRTGVYILLGMLMIFTVCTRLFFAKDKNIPDKEIDPIDEWAIKTKARRYIVWVAEGCAAVAILFALLSSPFLKQTKQEKIESYAELSNTENATANEARTDMASIADDVTDTESNRNESATAEAEETSPATETQNGSATAAIAEESVTSQATHHAFRGNNANGISTAKGLPVEWDLSSGKNIAWKQDIPRRGYNSPVIYGNKVFFSGADEQARELYCYDLTTGKQLWSLAAANIPGSPSQLPKVSNDTGLAASSVTCNGHVVCAIFATGDIICADMNGKQIWAKNLGIPEINYGYASSLLIYGNTVIVQYDEHKSPKVMALDLANGAERWSKARDQKEVWSSPMIASINSTPQLILMGTQHIIAYNPGNGSELWRVEFKCSEVCTSACSADGIVFGANEYTKIVAINGSDGSVLWESIDFLPEIASPVATKENLYIATTYGVAAAFDAKTGELRKEHELMVDFNSSPVIADGKIYLICRDGKMHIFSADNEFKLLHAFETGEKTYATPAFTDGKIVVRTEKSIYCVANR